MIEKLWRNFPRLLERNINALLDSAEPNPAKAFMLYRTCKFEGLWGGSWEDFHIHLQEFYSVHRSERRKSQFDKYLDRPMDQDIFSSFDLNFRNACISDGEIHNLASWTHNLIRVAQKTQSQVISISVLEQTLKRLTQPGPYEKDRDIRFEDFCEAWQKAVFQNFGHRHSAELNEILRELKNLDAQIKLQELEGGGPQIQVELTNIELDWVLAIRTAVFEDRQPPQFPGPVPEKQVLKELERLLSLYRIVQTTNLRELFKHRDRIYQKLLDHCDSLLGQHYDEAA